MPTIRSLLLLVSIASLPACAPTVWDKPGATPGQFSADTAQCGLIAAEDLKLKVATNEAPDLLGGIAQRMTVSRTHDRCMASKGYVASMSGAPRGSRTWTYRPLETATLVATADVEYYRGNSAADLLRFHPFDSKLAVNQDHLYNSYARADAVQTASAGVDLLADLSARWRQLLSTVNF